MNALKNLSVLSKHAWIAVLGVLFAFGCMFVSPSQANAQNFDVNAAFGWQGLILDDHRQDWHGPMFSLSFGYRFMDGLGVYLEQDLGGLIFDNEKPLDDVKLFNGATIISARGIYTVGQMELWGKLGIGAIYTADSDGDWGDEAWFAFRCGIGLTYMFMSNIGAGLDFSYTVGADDSHNHFDDEAVSFLSVKLHVSFRF